MLDHMGEWATALDLTTLPLWAVAGSAALIVVVCAVALFRGVAEGRSVPAAVLVLLIALLGAWWARDYFAGRDRVAERRALENRVFELAMRAIAPGSALGCLDPLAGETVEVACEKALFASPEATAAALSYVAAQLSVLRSAAEVGDRAANPALLALRRAIEADRFGIVAHVLAVRDGCRPDQCSAFGWLRDSSRIKVHLAERPFEARLKSASASWSAAGTRGLASNAPAPAPSPATRTPNNLYFPSAASIPPVNIMTAEPPPAQRQPQDTTGAAAPASSTAPLPPRRPPQADVQARPSPSAAPAPPAPAPLAPSQ
ncbi:MAG TPA: hypothetical protein VKB89_01350 [Xanthobacteraceae bacterium]|nr:hypothetical protein [Xanthobacteraceae bacterium]